jgi:hypothetical protein
LLASIERPNGNSLVNHGKKGAAKILEIIPSLVGARIDKLGSEKPSAR